MSRRALWSPPTDQPGSPTAAPARPVAADAAQDGLDAQPAPAAPTGQHSAPGRPLPSRSAFDAHVGLARLADMFTEAARILRELSEVQLEIARESRLMSSVTTAPERPRLLRVQDLAEILKVEARTVRRMRARGELPPALDFGSVLRWDEATVLTWLEGRRER